MTRRPLILASVTTLIALVLATVHAGVPGGASAVLAGAVICLTFSITFWLRDQSDRFSPFGVMAMALGVFCLKVSVLGLLLLLPQQTAWFERESFGFSMFGVTISWIAGLTWEASRRRTRIYDHVP